MKATKTVSIDDYKFVMAMLYYALDDERCHGTPWDDNEFREYANKYGLTEETFDPNKVYPIF